MISGVAFLLIGQTLFWPSKAVGLWALVFITINHIYFVFSEEPGLEKRFGEPYRKYKANVLRSVPRLRPWTGFDNASSSSICGLYVLPCPVSI